MFRSLFFFVNFRKEKVEKKKRERVRETGGERKSLAYFSHINIFPNTHFDNICRRLSGFYQQNLSKTGENKKGRRT